MNKPTLTVDDIAKLTLTRVGSNSISRRLEHNSYMPVAWSRTEFADLFAASAQMFGTIEATIGFLTVLADNADNEAISAAIIRHITELQNTRDYALYGGSEMLDRMQKGSDIKNGK